MRTLLIAAAALASASAAGAVTVTSYAGAPDPGPFGSQQSVVTFDAPNATGYSFGVGIHTAPMSISGAAAPSGDTTTFGYVSSAFSPSSSTLTTPDLKSISFYWGSIDTYNSVDVLGAGGVTLKSVVGGSIPPADGNQSLASTNRRVDFVAGPGETITGLRFNTSGVAFEFDSVAATAVPEPTSWALLVGGFGLVGLAGRRRRTTVVAA